MKGTVKICHAIVETRGEVYPAEWVRIIRKDGYALAINVGEDAADFAQRILDFLAEPVTPLWEQAKQKTPADCLLTTQKYEEEV
jgi:hypothetical protein